MARCQCGGDGCNCVVIAGENAAVTGAGSTLNPYVVSAVIGCEDVRPCLSAGQGATYDPATGVIATCPSADAGNNLTYGSDGCLFVPTGAATVSTGCGLTGDGSGSAPLAANTGTWPYTCDVDTAAGGVYCGTDGVLRSDPPARGNFFQTAMNQTFDDLTVPSPETTVASLSLTFQNTDTCRPAMALVWQDVDADLFLPPNSGGMYGISTDDMYAMQNHGSSPLNAVHAQTGKLININVPAGGSATSTLDVTMGRGFGGATYSRIQAGLRAWVFSLPN